MPVEQVHSIHRAFALLDCFTQETPELGVRKIARQVHLSSSTAGRLLAALKEEGVLSQNSATRAYSLGPRLLVWAGIYSSTLDIRSKALTFLQELYKETQETISLYLLDGNDRVCVERLESSQNVRIVARIGRRLPLYAGSAGKVLLAFLPPARQEEYLQTIQMTPLTAKTISNPDGLRRELAKIRGEGYAVSHGEWILEASGVSAPIFDHQGEVAAAITISGPGQRFDEATVARYVAKILPVAAQISQAIGYLPNHIIHKKEKQP
ncbi:MAG: IclR family transcriptional regulator [Chloroflexi bacterium]|nr:IclR family transcriptional regulator [Chloroflexota bacterium]